MTVGAILNVKGDGVLTITESQTVGTLSQQLQSARIGAMIVSDDGQSIDGIVSERDIAYGLVKHGNSLADAPVSDIMVRSVVTCTAKDTIAEAAKIMIEKNIRHLPVTNGTRLMGIISIRDILKFV